MVTGREDVCVAFAIVLSVFKACNNVEAIYNVRENKALV